MSHHRINAFTDANGEHRWNIIVTDEVPTSHTNKIEQQVVADSGEGYANKSDMLNSLFGIFFGTYDETFLELYNEWNPANQDKPNIYTDVQVHESPPPQDPVTDAVEDSHIPSRDLGA